MRSGSKKKTVTLAGGIVTNASTGASGTATNIGVPVTHNNNKRNPSIILNPEK
jgi:hypothetical protein